SPGPQPIRRPAGQELVARRLHFHGGHEATPAQGGAHHRSPFRSSRFSRAAPRRTAGMSAGYSRRFHRPRLCLPKEGGAAHASRLVPDRCFRIGLLWPDLCRAQPPAGVARATRTFEITDFSPQAILALLSKETGLPVFGPKPKHSVTCRIHLEKKYTIP